MDRTDGVGADLLYLIDSLGAGGAERSLAEMLPRLADRGIRPMVVTLTSRQAGVRDQVRASGIRVHALPAGGWGTRIRALRGLIRRTGTRLVHTTLFDSDIVGRLAAAGLDTTVMTSLVNTTYDPVRLRDPAVSRHRLAAARLIDGLTARHLTDHFHAISETVKAAAVRDLGVDPHRITVVERGRDPERLGRADGDRRARARAALALPSGAPVLVNVGRQEFQKGQRFLLRAMAAVLDHHHGAVLLVAGRRGHASPDLERLREGLGLGERVRFLGHREDVPEILAAADLFVFPSVYEGLGGALIEALALEVPIVASDLPAIREVVEAGRTGLLVPPADPAALAGGILTLLGDPDRARVLATRGRETFERRFTLEGTIGRMAALYASVLDREVSAA